MVCWASIGQTLGLAEVLLGQDTVDLRPISGYCGGYIGQSWDLTGLVLSNFVLKKHKKHDFDRSRKTVQKQSVLLQKRVKARWLCHGERLRRRALGSLPGIRFNPLSEPSQAHLAAILARWRPSSCVLDRFDTDLLAYFRPN